MDLYIKWKLRQIYKHFYTILIPFLFQFLQLLEQVCIFFPDESGSKMKIKRNSNQNEYQQTTIYACNIHCGNITFLQRLIFFLCFCGFFGVFAFFLNIGYAVHIVRSMTAHTLVSHCWAPEHVTEHL